MNLHQLFDHRGARHRFPCIAGDDRIPDGTTELVVFRNGRQRFTALKRSYASGQIAISRSLDRVTARGLNQAARRQGHIITTWGITPSDE
jgi:hypothetical protein